MVWRKYVENRNTYNKEMMDHQERTAKTLGINVAKKTLKELFKKHGRRNKIHDWK